ncbi:hypothetical protein Bbelb_007590 [Branchiostoma belcheri]|nr:hypothetical protein Bbelb_007590 [Branchiostoma belcheri]
MPAVLLTKTDQLPVTLTFIYTFDVAANGARGFVGNCCVGVAGISPPWAAHTRYASSLRHPDAYRGQLSRQAFASPYVSRTLTRHVLSESRGEVRSPRGQQDTCRAEGSRRYPGDGYHGDRCNTGDGCDRSLEFRSLPGG